MSDSLKTPVALIIFNRPDLTERVLAEIAKVKPAELFVIADGPRPHVLEDGETCRAARSVMEKIDWDCRLIKNYSEKNLGCGHRPATGITSVFEHTDRAIILEDDVVPNPSFFAFCDELLEKYRDDERIMQICGHNYQLGHQRGPYSYFFSHHGVCAGAWATWRRAWKHFDFHMKFWPLLRDTTFLSDILGDEMLVLKWRRMFDTAYAGTPTSPGVEETDYWDFQWNFAIWSQNALSIFPNKILVSNIGYRPDGTHTKSPNRWANLPSEEIEFPLKHPPYLVRSGEADHFCLSLQRQAELARKSSVGVVCTIAHAVRGLREKISYLRKRG